MNEIIFFPEKRRKNVYRDDPVILSFLLSICSSIDAVSYSYYSRFSSHIASYFMNYHG